jgi:cytochrome c553
MKTSSILPWMLGAAALVGCSRNPEPPGGTAAPAAPPPAAQPAQASAPAQVPVKPVALPPEGSPQAGEQIAAKGGANGVTACISCHGAQGEGNAASGFPRIAGQSSYYLGKQLTAYAKGGRANPVMEPIAKAMNDQQVRDVSAYYATLGGTPAGAAAPASPAPTAKRGEQLAKVGDGARAIQACGNCHGPAGIGEPPTFPYLAGQHAGYLTAAMGEWKSGARKTDPSGQMNLIAQSLADADVAALSAYFSAQPPPPPTAKRVNLPIGSGQRPAVAAAAGAPGPKAPGGAGVTGSGTEQGSPLTGGGGGVGGGGSTTGTNPPAPPIKR